MADKDQHQERSDRPPVATDIMERSYERLDQIAAELGDRPVLQQAIMEVSTELDGTAHVSGPLRIPVPKQHNDRLEDVLMAAFHRAHEECKATETPEEGLQYAWRMLAIDSLTGQGGRHLADYTLAVSYPGLLCDLLIESISDDAADDDPWVQWVDSLIPVLRDACLTGSES
jgi:hypothetical protein